MVNSLISRSTWTQIELFLDKAETNLSSASNTIILAPIAGPLKALMGLTQIVAASILGVIALTTNDEALQQYSWEHIKHGALNILSGLIESIPVIASIFNAIKGCNTFNGATAEGVIYKTVVPSKWYPYETIVKRHLVFTDPQPVVQKNYTRNLALTNVLFSNLYPNLEDRDLVSLVALKLSAQVCLELAEISFPTVSEASRMNDAATNFATKFAIELYNNSSNAAKMCSLVDGKIELKLKKI